MQIHYERPLIQIFTKEEAPVFFEHVLRTGFARGVAQEVMDERDLALGMCCCSKTQDNPFPLSVIVFQETDHEKDVGIKPKKVSGGGLTQCLQHV